MQSNEPANVPILWVHPGAYPHHCTAERAEMIADMVRQGTTWQAAAAAIGVTKRRMVYWLQLGAEADADDAGPEDIRAPYHNLFLKVNQALGIATAEAQIRVFGIQPQWWLAHHPDARREFGASEEGRAISDTSMPDDTQTVDSTPSVAMVPSPQSLRTILRTLITAGAATIPDAREDPPMSSSDTMEGTG